MEYTNRTLLKEGRKRLDAAGIEAADIDAWLLFAGTTGLSRTEYLMRENDRASDEVVSRFFDKIKRRAGREPVQYIEGMAAFMGYEFSVNENVLIPRMDTEVLVSEALRKAAELYAERLHGTQIKLLDMCTGSGCIAESMYLLLKKDGYLMQVTASDVSAAALKVARLNAERLGADIEFIQGSLFEKIKGSYHMILSNPPYIRTDVIPDLEPEVREHEPALALDGRQDGLYFYREITAQAREHLEDGGYLMFEIGYDQGMEVCALCRDNGYTDIRVIKDLAGLDRVVTARLMC